MTTLRLIKSNGRSPSRRGVLLIALMLASFALSPMVRAVSPAPDGGYPGQNTAAGQNALFNLSPTDGAFNTAIGWVSLFSNTTGSLNTGVGAGTLWQNTSHNNTAVGAGALALNTTGDGNTATGATALLQNTTGRGNTAVGAKALFKNEGGGISTGNLNTAVGVNALTENTIGYANTAVGGGPGQTDSGLFPAALGSNTTGVNNTAVGGAPFGGNGALGSNTEGNNNTAIGAGALNFNTTGSYNTAVGRDALVTATGSDNVALGGNAGSGVTSASNVICIGLGGENVDNTTWIGNVYNKTTQSGITAPVIVSEDGQLGTVVSSERFKKDIATMDKASEVILSLRPVTFHYKTDTKGIPQFGLIAEEVAKVNPALVLPDKEGKPYTVRYDQVNAMLLNEFLKEHSTVQELKKEVAALTAGLQKVSAQLEASKPAPQVVNNP